MSKKVNIKLCTTTNSVKCFLCNKDFISGDESYLIFNERVKKDGSYDCPLSQIICAAIDIELEESTAHSTLLCKACNEIVLDFERKERQLFELRRSITEAYNKTKAQLESLMNKELMLYELETENIDHNSIIEEIIEEESALPNVIVVETKSVNAEKESEIYCMDEIMNESFDDLNERDAIIFDDSLDQQRLKMANEDSSEEYTTKITKDILVPDSLNPCIDEIEYLDLDHKQTIIEFQTKDDSNSDIASILNGKDKLIGQMYACDLCDSTFQTEAELNEHFAEQHVVDYMGEEFECEFCQICFKSYTALEEHLNDKHDELKMSFKCKKCSKSFTSKANLQVHMKTHNERPRPFKCNVCEKSFLTQQHLQSHRKIHTNERSFVCEVCQKTFSTQHNLDAHGIVHSNKRPFKCSICKKSFARKAEILAHERIHTGERPFKCETCGLSFKQRSNLTSHIKSTHLNWKLHKCDVCERSFKRRRLLEYHKHAVHTGERPYKCEHCPSSFVYPEHYKKHQRIHTGDKPFACEICGKCFNSSDNRNAHRFVHSDKKPYECVECGLDFMRKPLLLSHMKFARHISDTIIVNQLQINGTEIKINAVAMSTNEALEETDAQEFLLPDKEVDSIVNEKSEKLVKTNQKFLEFDDFAVNWNEIVDETDEN